MKKSAYTLAEIILVILIIGALALIMMKNLNSSGINDKAIKAKSAKLLAGIEQALEHIKTIETEYCPASTFITKLKNNGTYKYEYAIVHNDVLANTDKVLELFEKQLEFEETGLKFCDYTSSCSDSNIKGAKLMNGEVFFGLEVYGDTSLKDCPKEYYLPNGSKVTKTDAEVGKCWGNVYVFIKGKKNESVEGKNYFVWGLGENGVAY